MIICIVLTVGAWFIVSRAGSTEKICNFDYMED